MRAENSCHMFIAWRREKRDLDDSSCGDQLSCLIFVIHPFSFRYKSSTNHKTLMTVSYQIHDYFCRRVLAREKVDGVLWGQFLWQAEKPRGESVHSTVASPSQPRWNLNVKLLLWGLQQTHPTSGRKCIWTSGVLAAPLSSVLTGRNTKHVKWFLPSVGPYDLVGGDVTAPPRSVLGTGSSFSRREQRGDVFISEPWWNPWCEVAEACPKCLCSLLGYEPRGTENDSIFSKPAHGPEVSGNCHCPTKSNTTGRDLSWAQSKSTQLRLWLALRRPAPRGHQGCWQEEGKAGHLQGLEPKACKARRGNIQKPSTRWVAPGRCYQAWATSWAPLSDPIPTSILAAIIRFFHH